MMALTLWHKERGDGRLLAVEKVGIAYTLLTALLIILFFHRLDHPAAMLIDRGAILLGIAVCYAVYRCRPCRLFLLLRVAYQLGLLAYWYPETYDFNTLFPNLDHLFASAEQSLFGCQPAVEFSRVCSSFWWCEAFNLGYFSYYPMIFGVVLLYFFCRYEELDRAATILVGGFFIYYLVYCFLPVVGPQYYFPAVGLDEIAVGHYPAVGDYFAHHTSLQPAPNEETGLFYHLVQASQQSGERPTAAFPSSHVGVSTIIMLLAYRAKPRFALFLLPFYLLLCCATVYIQAHYLIDSLAGLLTALLLYPTLSRASRTLSTA